MKVATWNVNSIRARMTHLRQWLGEQAPDIVGLQETKVQDADFPSGEISALGYRAVFAGQKAYNGTAILSRQQAREVSTALEGATEAGARFTAASFSDGAGETIRFINVYVINGKEVGAQAYDSKLDFFARLSGRIQNELKTHANLIVVGDFNVAPTDADVYDPEEWRDKILCSPRERACFSDLLERSGLRDTLREMNPDGPLWTWWDYRAARFRRKQGMRIDHILLSASLRARCARCWVDEAPRKLEKPSDHAPVLAALD